MIGIDRGILCVSTSFLECNYMLQCARLYNSAGADIRPVLTSKHIVFVCRPVLLVTNNVGGVVNEAL